MRVKSDIRVYSFGARHCWVEYRLAYFVTLWMEGSLNVFKKARQR